MTPAARAAYTNEKSKVKIFMTASITQDIFTKENIKITITCQLDNKNPYHINRYKGIQD